MAQHSDQAGHTVGHVRDPHVGVSRPYPELQDCLGSLLGTFERTVGFAEGVVMAFDPDVLLPTAFAATVERGLDDALVACRNEQLDRDFLKFRELATGPVRVGAASRDSDPRARTSRRWLEILDVRGHGHELRAALVDGSGQCWGALNLMRDAGHPFKDRDVQVVQARIERGADAIARSMVAAGTADASSLEPGSVWLDEDGSLVFASPAAQHWLDLLDAQSHAGFARALLAGLAMRAARAAAPDGHPDPAASGASGAIAVRVRTAGGRWVRARAEPIAEGALARGVVIAIDAARPGSLLPLAASAYRLTGREVEVVRNVLNGRDTRSVAASLHITEYTVQDHLKSVFAKVGVRSRRELAHLLALQVG
jgi:DNA-binding NarL/FixJ family response regulator